MNSLFLWSFSTIMFFSNSAFTLEGQLQLHLECPAKTDGCIEVALDSEQGKFVHMRADPTLIIGTRELEDVALVLGEDEVQLLQLRFKENISKKLAELTSSNIGRRLVITESGRALTAPVISEAITGGTVQISNGKSGWDSIPWLRVAAEERMPGTVMLYFQSAVSLIVIGLVIGIPIYFFRKRRRVNSI